MWLSSWLFFFSMKTTFVHIFVIFVIGSTTTQPTHDPDQESDCASQDDFEMLQNKVALLEEKFNRLQNSLTTNPSVASRPTSAY